MITPGPDSESRTIEGHDGPRACSESGATRRRLTGTGRPGPARARRGIKCVIGALVKVPQRTATVELEIMALTQASTGRLQFSSSPCLFSTWPTPTPGPGGIPPPPRGPPPSLGDPSPAGRPLAG